MADTDLILAAKASSAEIPMANGEIGPMTLNDKGRLRTVNKKEVLPLITGDLSAAGNALISDVTEAESVVIHVRNSGTSPMTAGTYVFEGSLDSTNGSDGTWFGLQGLRTNANTVETSYAGGGLAAGTAFLSAWRISVNAVRWFRIRCTVTNTSGAVAKWSIGRSAEASEPIPASITHGVTISGTPTVSVTNTPDVNIANVPAVIANPPIGLGFSRTSTATTNADLIKGSAGNLDELTIFNPTAATVHLKLYNKATNPTVGTDVPVLTIPVPAAGVQVLNFGPIGKRFSLGIAMAITVAAAATDTAAIGAGVQVSASYI